MKRILTKWDKLKLGRRLHYLQKRLHRAEENGYQDEELREAESRQGILSVAGGRVQGEAAATSETRGTRD